MHGFRCTYGFAAKRLRDDLMAQTDAQDWQFRVKSMDNVETAPGLPGSTRPRREYDGVWREFSDLYDRDLIVSNDCRFHA